MKKVIISSKVLLKAMQQNQKCINKSIALPICEDYLINVSPGECRIVTTDLENYVINKLVPTSFEALESFSFTLPGESIKYLSKIEEVPLLIAYDPKNNIVTLEHESEKAKYSVQSAEEFPQVPEVKVSASIDLSLIGSFLGYCGKDELRPIMSGVNVSHGPNGLRLCATNAHILKVATVEGTTIEKAPSIVIPFKACKMLNDFKAGICQYGTGTDKHGGENVSFEITPNLTIIARVIEGRFPNFDAVIPLEGTTFLTTDKKELLKVIDKASLFSNQTTNQICINMNGSTVVSAEDVDFKREFSGKLAADKKGNDLEIYMNSRFLTDLLKDTQGEKVTLEMSLPNRTIVIKENNTLKLMMPAIKG